MQQNCPDHKDSKSGYQHQNYIKRKHGKNLDITPKHGLNLTKYVTSLDNRYKTTVSTLVISFMQYCLNRLLS